MFVPNLVGADFKETRCVRVKHSRYLGVRLRLIGTVFDNLFRLFVMDISLCMHSMCSYNEVEAPH